MKAFIKISVLAVVVSFFASCAVNKPQMIGGHIPNQEIKKEIAVEKQTIQTVDTLTLAAEVSKEEKQQEPKLRLLFKKEKANEEMIETVAALMKKASQDFEKIGFYIDFFEMTVRMPNEAASSEKVDLNIDFEVRPDEAKMNQIRSVVKELNLETKKAGVRPEIYALRFF